MDILELIEIIKQNSECMVKISSGLPKLENNFKLPKDLELFYKYCGGITLFKNKNCEIEILSPDKFKLANPIIVGELLESDISSTWFTICQNGNGDYITIDLDENRLGRCYDSFWECHGVVGECQIVANNFTELIANLFRSNGENYFWLEENFKYIGDAYD